MVGVYLVVTAVLVCLARAREIIVSSDTCGMDINRRPGEPTTTLIYNGDYLNVPCSYSFNDGRSTLDMCVEVTAFNLPCDIKVYYDQGYNSEGDSSDRTITCADDQPPVRWCALFASAYITFARDQDSRGSGGGKTQFKIFLYDKFATDEGSDDSSTSIGLVLGIVGAVAIFVMICVVFRVICVRRRRQQNLMGGIPSAAYHSPQQAVANTAAPATYPYQQPPPPQGYGAGYQPPPPPQGYGSGYQPPPPPQGYGSGYQPTSQPTAPPAMPVQASAGQPQDEMQGMLQCKQDLESGGKNATMRDWQSYYCVLFGQRMGFFKDKEGYLERYALAPPLNLDHAQCQVETDHHKSHVLRLKLHDGAEYLLEAASQDEMFEWCRHINQLAAPPASEYRDQPPPPYPGTH